MLFTASAHPGLERGEITRTYRSWARPQVKVGGRYHAGRVDLMVDDLRQVPVRDIGDDDARASGFPDREALLTFLRRRRPLADADAVWQVDFRAVDRVDEPSIADDTELSDPDLEELGRRLARLDAASPTGPWTSTVLHLVADNPGVVSTDLAEKMGRERAAFKTDVRKLKRLGLTISLDVGYRLSPRGEAFLAR
jgi:hypothetical protein